jgi:hypothetical protein
LGALASSAAAQTRVASGSYVGAASDQTISGLGFEPDVVIVKGGSADRALVCSKGIATGNQCRELLGTTSIGTAITYLSDGFRVNTDNHVNRLGATYHWVAFKLAAGQSAYGSYVGNGADDRSIVGLGFQPTFVLLLPLNAHPVTWRTAGMPVGQSLDPQGAALVSDAIQAFETDGFQVGASQRVNSNINNYHYLAFGAASGMTQGSYTGDGNDGKAISGPGFLPEWVLLKGDGQSDAAHRAASLPSSESQRLEATGNDTDCIQALTPSGFALGTQTLCNGSGVTYYWAAWRDVTATAVPGQIFESDFESGTLSVNDAPPGEWPNVDAEPNIALSAAAAAAHRGGFGMRVHDQDPQTGNHPGSHGEFDFSATPVTTGSYFARFWMRLTSSNDVGDIAVGRIAGTGLTGGGALNAPGITFPGAVLQVGGYDATPTFLNDITSLSLVVGQWYLVEMGASGFGTANGNRTVWVDGALIHDRSPINWTGVAVTIFDLGLPNSNESEFVGVLDFDDARTSLTAPASTLKVAAPTGAGTGDCVPVGVSLVTSSGVTADAPYDVVVSLASGGEGAFYSNVGCTSTATTATIATGASSVTAYFKSPNQATVLLSASHLDFLGGSASLNVIVGGCSGGPVQLVEDATPLAIEGVPYSLNPGGVPTVGGGGGTPVFSSCNGVPGLSVDAGTGAVAWTPAAEGPVELCLQVNDACGSDSYAFTVLVAPPPIDLALDPVDPGSGGGRIGTRVKVTGTVAAGVGSVSEAQLDLRSQGLYLETVELDGVALAAAEGRYGLPDLQPGQARAMKITAVVTAPARSEAWMSAGALSRAGTPASPTVEARLRAAPVRMGVGCGSTANAPANLLLAVLAIVVCYRLLTTDYRLPTTDSAPRRRLRLAPARARRRPGSDPESGSSR